MTEFILNNDLFFNEMFCVSVLGNFECSCAASFCLVLLPLKGIQSWFTCFVFVFVCLMCSWGFCLQSHANW